MTTLAYRRRRGRAARPDRLVIAALAVASAAALLPAAASARATASVPYATGSVWAAAVRFLRVDRGLPIREKDEAAGYVLFDFAEGGKSYHGAVELVPIVADDDGRGATKISVSIPGLPKRFEITLLDQLTAKVRDERDERGSAPPPRRATAPDPSDKDKGRDREKERDREREKEKEKDSTKPPTTIDPSGLPRAPTLPSP